jgi:high-affinity iron transporter
MPRLLLLPLLLLTCWFAPLTAGESPTHELAPVAATLQQTLSGTDQDAMRRDLATFTATWNRVEEAVRKADRQAYAAIEEAMGDLDYQLTATPFDHPAARAAAAQLATLVGAATAPARPQAKPAVEPLADLSLRSVHDLLSAAQQAAVSGNGDQAAAQIATARRAWPDVEGEVKTRDHTAYLAIETLLAQAHAQAQHHDPQTAATLGQLTAQMAPFLAGGSYGVIDAFLILLREGIEALLVIAALLAFLGRSGHGTKQPIIWWGAAAGVALSVGFAFLINQLFSASFSGTNRELIEGVVGLLAAGLLFWVSWWLHRAASLSLWNAFIATKTQAALSTGSLWSLGSLAFLAVVREGAETALFYLGMAPSISTGDLLLGIALAIGALVVVGVVVVRLGARLPVRPFFAALGILVLVMGVKFIGTGIHALQVSQVIGTSPVPVLPACEWLGFFPTLETIAGQGLALTVMAAVWWLSRQPKFAGANSASPAVTRSA